MAATRKLLMCQLHDPARGPFEPTIDTNSSMLTGTRIMRNGKTQADRYSGAWHRRLANRHARAVTNRER